MRFTLFTPAGHSKRALVLAIAVLMLPCTHIEAKTTCNRIPACDENCKDKGCASGETCRTVHRVDMNYCPFECFECQNCTVVRTPLITLTPGQTKQLEEHECLRINATCSACPECNEATSKAPPKGKYNITLVPSQVRELDKEECAHVKVTCGACPDYSQRQSATLTSSSEASHDLYQKQRGIQTLASSTEANPKNAEFGCHFIVEILTALGISLVINLLLLGIIVSNCRRNNSRQTMRGEVHEFIVDENEMERLK